MTQTKILAKEYHIKLRRAEKTRQKRLQEEWARQDRAKRLAALASMAILVIAALTLT